MFLPQNQFVKERKKYVRFKITPQRETLIQGYNNELFALLQITTAYLDKKDTENNLNLAVKLISLVQSGTPLEKQNNGHNDD